jgi:hypothetical protein
MTSSVDSWLDYSLAGFLHGSGAHAVVRFNGWMMISHPPLVSSTPYYHRPLLHACFLRGTSHAYHTGLNGRYDAHIKAEAEGIELG